MSSMKKNTKVDVEIPTATLTLEQEELMECDGSAGAVKTAIGGPTTVSSNAPPSLREDEYDGISLMFEEELLGEGDGPKTDSVQGEADLDADNGTSPALTNTTPNAMSAAMVVVAGSVSAVTNTPTDSARAVTVGDAGATTAGTNTTNDSVKAVPEVVVGSSADAALPRPVGGLSIRQARRQLSTAQFRKFQRQRKVEKEKAANVTPVRPVAVKRNRSEEEPRALKRTKTGKKSYAEVAGADLRMAIVNKSEKSEWRLTDESAVIVMKILEEKFIESRNDPTITSPPIYLASGLIKGHILVTCENASSKVWLRNTVRKINLDNHWIDCVGEDTIPKLVIMKLCTHLSDQTKVVDMLKWQNPSLNVNEWKIIGDFERKEPTADHGFRLGYPKYGLKFAITQTDAKAIEDNEGVYFLFKKIPVQGTRTVAKDKQDGENNPSESPAQ